MKVIILHFDEDLLERHYQGWDGTECLSYDGLKKPVCDMFELSGTISWLKFDFETEDYSYMDGAEEKSVHFPGLAAREMEIMGLIGYVQADMSNAFDLVNALINGKMSDDLFNVLMDVEGMQNEANPGIKEFLRALGENGAED